MLRLMLFLLWRTAISRSLKGEGHSSLEGEECVFERRGAQPPGGRRMHLRKDPVQQILEESSKMENLRILKKVEFPIDNNGEVAVLLQKCPNLQELEIIFARNKGVNDSLEICLKLDSLIQLQVLDVFIVGGIILSELHLPSNLKKLTLRGPHVLSTASMVAGLPNLEYLHLMWGEGEEWCLGDITFDKLKRLNLDGLHMSRWDVTEESFPVLETVAINNCRGIQEIPLCFADIPTLKQIKLNFCESESLEASAWKIKEEAEATEGCDRLDLVIESLYRKGNYG